MSDLASIVLCTYNGSKYIKSQLESIAAQDYEPIEVIIQDDNSDDNTVEICREWIAQNRQINARLFKNKLRHGYAQNFGIALGKATGKIIFLCDQDDYWFPEKISTVIHSFDSKKVAIICDCEFTNTDLSRTSKSKLDEFRRFNIPETNYVMGCASAFRKEFIEMALPFPKDIKYHDDYLLSGASAVDTVQIFPKVLQLYRIHGENSSTFFINQSWKKNKTSVYLSRIRRIFSVAKGGSRYFEILTELRSFQLILRYLSSNSPNHRDCSRIRERIEVLDFRRQIINRSVMIKIYYTLLYWNKSYSFKERVVDIIRR